MKNKKPAINSNLTAKNSNIHQLYNKIYTHINNAREGIKRSIDTQMVKAYWLMGRDIVEEEQKGKAKANYASYMIEESSIRLNKQYGKGFSITALKDARQFYLTYQDYFPISHKRS